MKTLFIALTVLVSTQTFAATCKLASTVAGGFDCYGLSTKLEVADQEACEAFAKSTRDNRFFGIVESKKERVISTKITYKDKAQRLKVKKAIVFEEYEDVCF